MLPDLAPESTDTSPFPRIKKAFEAQRPLPSFKREVAYGPNHERNEYRAQWIWALVLQGEPTYTVHRVRHAVDVDRQLYAL